MTFSPLSRCIQSDYDVMVNQMLFFMSRFTTKNFYIYIYIEKNHNFKKNLEFVYLLKYM